MSKEELIYEYSNPDLVKQRANDFYLNPVHISSRKDKKYMVFDGRKMQHFGQWGYIDYTKSQDEEKRNKFRKRNDKWKYRNIYSPAWLSYNLLW